MRLALSDARYLTASYVIIFFFSSRRRHTRFDCDWSSDVCSSDLLALLQDLGSRAPAETARIGLDIVDQVEHARGRMLDQGAAANSRHEYRTFRQSTGRARIGDNTEMSKNSGKDKAKSATANKTIALNKREIGRAHV